MKKTSLITSLLCVLGLLASSLSVAQPIDFSGEWRPIFHEDGPERLPGPGFGDFSGIPINEQGLMRGRSYDPNRISMVTEYICRQHGGDYAMRGLADLRILRDIDPRTQQTVAFKTRMGFHNMERTIWLDGREHPHEDAPHTFQGFSTGVWNGNVLVITTTHLKQSYLRRNGLPASSERTATEYWMLHGGQYLTVMTVIDDPVFLTEPLVRTQDFQLDPSRRGGFNNCEYTTEVPINPDNLVPHYLPGENPFVEEFAEIYHLPQSGVNGGAESVDPEFREVMGEPVGDNRFCTNEDCDS